MRKYSPFIVGSTFDIKSGAKSATHKKYAVYGRKKPLSGKRRNTMSDSTSPKKDNTRIWVVCIGIILFCCLCGRWEIRLTSSSNNSSPVFVQQEGGHPVTQPTNVGEPNTYTLYATYHFGNDQEYASPLAAAQAAQAKFGNRPIKVYCDDLAWDSTLDTFIAELGKETIFGVPKDNFCQNGGYIEAWPVQ